MKMEQKLNECGILSVRSWQLLFLVVLMTSGLNLVLVSITLELHQEPLSHVSDLVGPDGVVFWFYQKLMHMV